MAVFEADFPDDFLSELLETEFDEIAEEALTKALPILEESVKKEVKKVISHDGDSEMVNSFTALKPVKRSDGTWKASVIPRGYSKIKIYKVTSGKEIKKQRKYPVSHALKAIWKEYGLPGHQSAQPFMDKAANAARSRVEKIIEDAFNKEIEKYEL